MKRWGMYGMNVILIIALPCQARTIYEGTKSEIRHQKRKEAEHRYAESMVAHAKKRAARSRAARNKEIQDTLDLHTQLALQADIKTAHLNERQHFASLMRELSTPSVAQRPILEIIHEAECTLQQVGSHNPRLMHRYQAQLEQVLKEGKHPLNPHEKKRYSNADLMARQSIQTLVEYTCSAGQMVEEVAQQAAEIKCDLMQTVREQQKNIASLENEMARQLNASENRIQKFNAKLTALDATLRKTEHDAALKESEAINLAQHIDTFNSISSTLSQERLNATEKNLQNLENQIDKVTQLTEHLILRLQRAENNIVEFENQLQQTTQPISAP